MGCSAAKKKQKETVPPDATNEEDIEPWVNASTGGTLKADVRVEYRVGASAVDASGDLPVLISIRPTEEAGRRPSDIVCVIDTSWSMTLQAKSACVTEGIGLSNLDIAKHAVRTVFETLGPEDRFSLVEFCQVSRLCLPLTFMTEQGKRKAEDVLRRLTYGNGTCLWEGISLGLDQLTSVSAELRRAHSGHFRAAERGSGSRGIGHLMVLTDGAADDRDSVMPKLRKRRANNSQGRLEGTINCFGFGYEIDSALLTQIASFSNGAYAFIPDSAFVGTIFVNSISNLLVTLEHEFYLTLKAQDAEDAPRLVADWLGSQPLEDGSVEVALGALQMGQSRDVVVRMGKGTSSVEPFKTCSLRYSQALWDRRECKTGEGVVWSADEETLVEVHVQRNLFLLDLRRAIDLALSEGKSLTKATLDRCSGIIDECAKRVEDSVARTGAEALQAILEDITGEIAAAFATVENWDRWGRHYLPSVLCAHRLQQCNNFKDPGVQLYGGSTFAEVRDAADEAFNKLPPPNVTPAKYRYLGGGKVVGNRSYQAELLAVDGPSGRQQSTLDMAVFNDRNAGCIDGTCEVQLASGERRCVSCLRRGDVVECGAGRQAEVVCVARTRCAGGVASLVALPGGPRLTPHHPVLLGGRWCFPSDVAAIGQHPCEAVYSFVLNGASDLLVDGVPCISLAHGIKEGAARHPYFGTELVLQDLARDPGFAAGFVELRPEGVVRDPDTGVVRGLLGIPCGPEGEVESLAADHVACVAPVAG